MVQVPVEGTSSATVLASRKADAIALAQSIREFPRAEHPIVLAQSEWRDVCSTSRSVLTGRF